MTPADTLAALDRGELGGARRLSLAGLGLSRLPDGLFALAPTLEELDLAGNALTGLPDRMAHLGRLRVLFLSGNGLVRLPPVLGACPALEQIGARGCGLHTLQGEALPPRLRWLTLTDNRLEQVPAALAERPLLQKLLLAGNRLSCLPEALAAAPRLELIRLSANALPALPAWLPEMPQLAWAAWAGNPFDADLLASHVPEVPWEALRLGPLLGEGASGQVHAAGWLTPSGERRVALKLFKGSMTSDGLPEREMAACLASGAHPGLVGALGRLSDHPEGRAGLLMPLLPASWRPLAAPPSLSSCSRDLYPAGLTLPLEVALRIAATIGRAMAHLHERDVLHGDLYAHNILWDGANGIARLSDFGAASALPPGGMGRGLRRVEMRAWGILLAELLDHVDEPVPDALRVLAEACLQPDPTARPEIQEALPLLST